MPAERATPTNTPDSRHAAAPAPPQINPATAEILPAPAAARLLADPALRGRGNGGVRQRTLLAAQRTYGNRAVQRMRAAGASRPVPVQRVSSTGLADPAAIAPFVNNLKALKIQWPDMEPWDRAAALAATALDQLAKLGVPRCHVSSVELAGWGEFQPAIWTIEVNKRLTNSASAAEDEMDHAATTIYHEVRHAEQVFRQARLLAGRGRTADEILKELGIPPEIAQAAVQQPLTAPGTAAPPEAHKVFAEAESWYESAHGTGQAHKTKSQAEVRDALDLQEQARRELDDAAEQLQQIEAALAWGQQAVQEELAAWQALETARAEWQQHDAPFQVLYLQYTALKQRVEEAQAAGTPDSGLEAQLQQVAEQAIQAEQPAVAAWNIVQAREQDYQLAVTQREQAEQQAQAAAAIAGQATSEHAARQQQFDLAVQEYAAKFKTYAALAEEADAYAVEALALAAVRQPI